MPIKLYASTKVLSKEDPESLADDELARISAGEGVEEEDDSIDLDDIDLQSDTEEDEDEGGFLDEAPEEEEDDQEDEDSQDENNLANLYDLLTAYFKVNEAPTDPEFHALAQSIGMDPDDLEAIVYKVMSIMMSDDVSKDAVEDAIEEAEDDSEDDQVESDVMPYSPAEAEEDGAPDLDTMPVESSVSKRLRYSLSRR